MNKSYHNIFSRFLKNKKQVYSSQRIILVNEIFKVHGHFSLKPFINKICKKYKNISRATIFRTIKLLLEAGLINKTSDTDNVITYEHTFGHKHHDHLICIKCKYVKELSNNSLEIIKTKVCKTEKFLHKYHNLQIYGVCNKCKKKEK